VKPSTATALALAAMLAGPLDGLTPKPKRLDCPKCGQSKLMRSEAMSYCHRCGHIEKKEPKR
jgi:ribosomal protein S27AE